MYDFQKYNWSIDFPIQFYKIIRETTAVVWNNKNVTLIVQEKPCKLWLLSTFFYVLILGSSVHKYDVRYEGVAIQC